MTSYSDFLDNVENNFEDKQKFQKYYLTTLVRNLDKAFVVDLARVFPQLLPPEAIIKESIEFIDFALKSSETLEMSNCFQSFLVF